MITRDVHRAERSAFDLIVIGGGIQGSCLALQTARRGLRVLLVERGDFGCGTTWNSLRIVHGGLRHLQRGNLRKFFEAVADRRWFLANFPSLVTPLCCLLPLYERGVRRKTIMRQALATNDLLSRRRNRGLRADRCLPESAIISADETLARIESLNPEGLSGAAQWYDAFIVNAPRLLMEIINGACAAGGVAINYCEARKLVVADGRVRGLKALDQIEGRTVEFSAPVVVNCAGPWVEQTGQRLTSNSSVPVFLSLGFNLLLERPPVSQSAIGIGSQRAKASTYFLVPWEDRMIAGTFHAPWVHSLSASRPAPSRKQMSMLLDDVNEALPGLSLSLKDVAHCYSGILPTREPGSAVPSMSPRIAAHGKRGGPHGLYSVSSVKLTGAPGLAEKTIRVISRDWYRLGQESPALITNDSSAIPLTVGSAAGLPHLAQSLLRLKATESANSLADLFLRRVGWQSPHQLDEQLAQSVCELLQWPEPRREEEIDLLRSSLQMHLSECADVRPAVADK